MLDVVKQICDQALVKDIELPDQAVECIFSMRLMHHMGAPKNRIQMLKGFFRVSAGVVCLSLWVGGNRQVLRRQKLKIKGEAINPEKYNQNRFVISGAQIEQAFDDAGFAVLGHFDFLKYISMWRIYVLKKQTV